MHNIDYIFAYDNKIEFEIFTTVSDEVFAREHKNKWFKWNGLTYEYIPSQDLIQILEDQYETYMET